MLLCQWNFALLKLKEADIAIHLTFGCLVNLFVFITPSLWSHALFNILGIKVFSYSLLYDDFFYYKTNRILVWVIHSFLQQKSINAEGLSCSSPEIENSHLQSSKQAGHCWEKPELSKESSG